MKVINCTTLGEMCEAALDGEPVFVLRAQDALMLDTVKDYLCRVEATKEVKNSLEAKNGLRVRKQIERIENWQKSHKTRLPD